jgi:hypothetical protein
VGRYHRSLDGVRWWAARSRRTQLRVLVGRHAALAAGAPDCKGSRRKESFLLALEGATPDYLLKVNHYESLAPWRRLRRSKARAEMTRATMLTARGIPTPIPIAAGELRRAGSRAVTLVWTGRDGSPARLDRRATALRRDGPGP